MVQDIVGQHTVIRRAAAVDIPAVMTLAAAAPSSAQWACGAYNRYVLHEAPTVSTQLKALFVAWDVRCAPKAHVGERPQIAGFAAFSAIVQANGGECELENMAVAETCRRRGIASRLLVAGELWCRAQFTGSLWLEVRASNSAALAFYEHAGFISAGRRPGYYTHPDEDAIRMRKILPGHVQGC